MILQDPAHHGLVLRALAEMLADPAVKRVRVAVAYVNLAGVRALQRLLAAAGDAVEVEVVVTLDMGITRKAALEAMLRDLGESVSVIDTGSSSGTFHAKAFVVDRDGAAQCALVGSANLTYAALTTNHEAISVRELSQVETDAWEAWWADLLAAADDLTEDVIAGYSERRPPRGGHERIADEDWVTGEDGLALAPDQWEVAASSAEWLAIDWGGTGEYRVQCEFPKDAAAFFLPEGDQPRAITIVHEGAEYVDNQLTYYPDNGMVRINLDDGIPAVADGSIKAGTSLFTRLGPDKYAFRLIDEAERAARLAEAEGVGGVGRTRRIKDQTLRHFGWVG